MKQIKVNKISNYVKAHAKGYFGELLSNDIIKKDIKKDYPNNPYVIINCTHGKIPKPQKMKFNSSSSYTKKFIDSLHNDTYKILDFSDIRNKLTKFMNSEIREMEKQLLIEKYNEKNPLPNNDGITDIDYYLTEIKRNKNLIKNIMLYSKKELFVLGKTKGLFLPFSKLNLQYQLIEKEFIKIIRESNIICDYFCLIYNKEGSISEKNLIKIVIYEIKNNKGKAVLTKNQKCCYLLCNKSNYIDFKIIKLQGNIIFNDVTYEIV